ncbi:cytochrome P450 [Streptomyces sp. GbtcB7]|uniref:cytochrome P450 n=1 Tax=Streptomyces sp. GbtcB7 TaxID=2824752 RepID=UPI001C308A18|nr:cytochrome P450 [Streptomyces sp. GbtcB7]
MSTNTINTAIPDLSDPATFVPGVPHEALDAIREMPGLYWQPAAMGTLNGGFWCVTRHEEIIEIEKDPATFSVQWGPFYPALDEPSPFFEGHIMYSDPPLHSRLRRAAARSFGPRVVANFDHWVREIVVEVLDDIVARGEVDWVADVAALVPSRVVARVMGVPREDRQQIVDMANDVFSAVVKPDSGAALMEVVPNIYAFMEKLRLAKLRDPQDDMATVLAQCVERGELSQPECLHFMEILLVAGFETTHTLIGQSMRLVLENPEIAATVDKSLDTVGSKAVVEEFLRYVTPAMNMARTVTRDVEFRGVQMRKGDLVQLFFTAANRDPAVFTEPHRFDPARPSNDHMAFGNGAHHCIGNALARLEVRILFEEIHKRGITLRLNGEPKRGWSTFINQLFELPVTVAQGPISGPDNT